MQCPHCGKQVSEGTKFCIHCGWQLLITCPNCGQNSPATMKYCYKCGAPLKSDAPETISMQPVKQPQQPMRPAVPVSAKQQIPQSVHNKPAASSEAVVTKKRPVALIVSLVVSLIVIALVAAGVFVAYDRGLIGGVTVAKPADLKVSTVGTGSKKAYNAKNVADALRQRGLKVSVVRQFSGVPRGGMIQYQTAAGKKITAGTSVRRGSTVQVVASAGPGVPQGTVGQPDKTVRSSLKTMGVPVSYKSAPVSNTKLVSSHTVIGTIPQEGLPADAKTGITVILPTQEKSSSPRVPADLYGMDPGAAQDALTKLGVNTIVRDTFSSRKMLGKVIRTDPALGAPIRAKDDHNKPVVTLYRGVDASKLKDVLAPKRVPLNAESGTAPVQTMLTGEDALVGTYCNSSGDCFNINQGQYAQTSDDNAIYGPDNSDTTASPQQDRTVGHEYTLAPGSCPVCGPDRVSEVNIDDTKTLKNALITQNHGAFELFQGDPAMPDDGKGNFGTNTHFVVDDQTKKAGFGDSNADRSDPGFSMRGMLVYFPVGADLSAVEDSGYFDASALKAAQKDGAPDPSRPYILRRDTSAYPASQRFTAGRSNNPTAPFSSSSMLKVKPAPSADNVYYLMEGPVYDMDSLASDGKSSSTNLSYPSKSVVDAALAKGDFSPIAGRYCLKDNSKCFVLHKDGSVSARDVTILYEGRTGEHSQKLSVQHDGEDETNENVYTTLEGPDSEYTCKADDGTKLQGIQTCMDANVPLANFTSFPLLATYNYANPGLSSDAYLKAHIPGFSSDIRQFLDQESEEFNHQKYVEPDHSRPFIAAEAIHGANGYTTSAHTDEDVFYFVSSAE